MTDNRNSSDRLREIGEKFGEQIASLVRTVRAYAVTVSRIDADKNVAFVTFFSEETEFPVDMSLLGFGMMSATPNVGSLAVISFMNGDDTTPFFIAFEALDKIVIARGNTEIRWSITPPNRDTDGNEIAGETNDELYVRVGESSIKITDELIELNDGSNGGLINITALVDKVNALVKAFNDHIHSIPIGSVLIQAQGGMPNTAPININKTANPANEFKKDDFEDTKITH